MLLNQRKKEESRRKRRDIYAKFKILRDHKIQRGVEFEHSLPSDSQSNEILCTRSEIGSSSNINSSENNLNNDACHLMRMILEMTSEFLQGKLKFHNFFNPFITLY